MTWRRITAVGAAALVTSYFLWKKRGTRSLKEKSKESKPLPSPHDDENDEASGSSFMANLKDMFANKLKLSETKENKERVKVLKEVSFDGIVNYIKSGQCKNIIVLTGAGISTSAGIPDFRSPGTGLYNNLQKYNLPHPQAIFEIDYFKKNPDPFFALAKELFPGTFKPTRGHYFIKLLNDKSLLLRNFTQNIDTLEHVAKIPADKIVEAHGTFFTSHCLTSSCMKEYSLEWMRDKIFKDELPTCEICGRLVKPDIVFFGESLPDKFFKCMAQDFPQCDLLIIIGTSLKVQPFASLIDRVKDTTPRLLINLEKCGEGDIMMSLLGLGSGLAFDAEDNYRDVFWEGTADDGCQALADALGWTDELEALIKTAYEQIDAENIKKKFDPETPSNKAVAKESAEKTDDQAIPETTSTL